MQRVPPLFLAASSLALGGAAGASAGLDAAAWTALGLSLVAALPIAAVVRAPRTVAAAVLCALLFACAGLRARLALDAGPATVGRYERVRALEGAERGLLLPGTLELEIDPGVLEPGELALALDPVPRAALARGPVAGPGRGAERERVRASPDALVRIAPPAEPEGAVRALFADWRTTLCARLAAIEDREARALAAALCFGEVGALDPALPDLFVRTGTYHMLAVSGLQVVLLVALFVGPASALLAALARPLGRATASCVRHLAALAALIAYVPLAGGGPPVVRAALCCALGGVARGARAERPARVTHAGRTAQARLPRRASGLALWSLALAVECALRPAAALDLSVQLSYGATLGLILGARPLSRGLAPRAPRTTDALGRARSPWFSAVSARAGRIATGALAASLSAVVATLPFVWARLGEWSPAGVVATVAVGLPLLVLLAGGWIAALAPALVPQLHLDGPLELAADVALAMLRAFDALPGTPEPLPPRPALLVAAASVLAFVALRYRGPLARAGAARAAALAAAALLLPWTTSPRALEIVVLDVGSGTACALRAPGLGTWIYDAGSRDRPGVAREALGPLLASWDPGRVGIALSHGARDHDGSLDWVLERYPPRAWAGAVPARLAERLPHAAARVDLERGRIALPTVQGSCPGVAAWLERGRDEAGNEGSRSLRVAWFGEELLLSGDAEEHGLAALAQAALARQDGAPRLLRLWLAPHHGSESARLAEALEAWPPAEVWISGPAEPAIGPELDRRGIPWRSTGRDGPLSLVLPVPAGWNGTCSPDPP